MPFQHARVAIDWLNTKLIADDHALLFYVVMNANPIGLIITVISGAIAIVYLLYKNWDKLKAWWNS